MKAILSMALVLVVCGLAGAADDKGGPGRDVEVRI